jgi:hydroxymethylglutaryl-CoA lyase
MPTILNKAEVKLIECPRDAMQGMSNFIPTEVKISYINKLLLAGFHTLDCGSFVSPKAIPQMKDTGAVLEGIDLSNSDTKLSVIVANLRGAQDACLYDQIDFLGYPFSISETFQHRNTNQGINESVDLVKEILELSTKSHKEMVVYISMGFGNPYNEDWNSKLVEDWVGELHKLGISYFSISDTVGVSTPESITEVFKKVFDSFPNAEFGAHFHTTQDNWFEKVDAAYKNGCMRFDGAIKGYGGCPMANDDLVGNMPTEKLIEYFGWENSGIKKAPFDEAFDLANSIFI